jgi:hypothetical protein
MPGVCRIYLQEEMIGGEIGPDKIGPYEIGPSKGPNEIGPYKIGPL